MKALTNHYPESQYGAPPRHYPDLLSLKSTRWDPENQLAEHREALSIVLGNTVLYSPHDT